MKHILAPIILIFCNVAFANTVCVDHRKPIATSKPTFSSNTIDMLGKIPAQVRWNKVPGAKYYTLFISKTKNFKKARSFKRKSPYMPLMVYPDTKYYWKATPYNKSGVALNSDNSKAINKFTTAYTGDKSLPSIWLNLYRYYKQKAGVEDQIQYVEVESNPRPIEKDYAVDRGYTSKNNYETERDSVPENNYVTQHLIAPDSQRLPADDGSLPLCQPREPSSLTSANLNQNPKWLQGYRAWLSSEAGFLTFEQQHSVLTDVKATGMLFPSIGLHLQTKYFGRWAGEFYFNQVVGDFRVDSNSNIALLDKDFNWLFFGANARFKTTSFSLGSHNTDMILYVGAEEVKTPYFSQIAPTLVAVKDVDLINGYLGLRFETDNDSRWSYFWDTKYSQPFSAEGDDILSADISSSLLVDSKVGFNYRATENGLTTGALIKGVYTDVTERLQSSSADSTGDRNSLYFAIEVMAGFNF